MKWRDVWAEFVASLKPQAQQGEARKSPPDIWLENVRAPAPQWRICVHCAGRGDLIRDTGDGETTLEICPVCGGTGRLID